MLICLLRGASLKLIQMTTATADRKFVDAGLMGGADYIITYDGHFNIVKERPFPIIGVIDPDEFLVRLNSLTTQ